MEYACAAPRATEPSDSYRMSDFLKRPFLQVIGVDEAAAPELSQAAEILVARVAATVYRIVRHAPQDAVMAAAAAPSDSALLLALVTLASAHPAAEP